MKKGKLGILLSFYGILGFILVILKLPLLCAILLGFVLFAEKDEWAVRQVLQAFMLSLIVVLFGDVVPWVAALLPLPFISGFFTVAASVLSAVVYAAAIVFSIVAILKVMKDQEADLPLLSILAYGVYGKAKPIPTPTAYAPPYQQQPGQYAPPPPVTGPGSQAPAQPESAQPQGQNNPPQ